jgi:hypothetical protein
MAQQNQQTLIGFITNQNVICYVERLLRDDRISTVAIKYFTVRRRTKDDNGARCLYGHFMKIGKLAQMLRTGRRQ